MEVVLKGNAKEIAALVLALQKRQGAKVEPAKPNSPLKDPVAGIRVADMLVANNDAENTSVVPVDGIRFITRN